MKTITDINELKDAIDYLTGLNATRDDLSRVKKEVEEKIEAQELLIQNALEAVGLDRFEGTDSMVSIVHKSSAKMPQDNANRLAFFAWLKSHGLDNLLTVNSQTLNKLYNTEKQEAESKGILNFHIPGIEGVKEYKILSLRRKK